jgi:RHS repeat-associated protein
VTEYAYDELTMTPPGTSPVTLTNAYNSSGQIVQQVQGSGSSAQETGFAYSAVTFYDKQTNTTTNGTTTTETTYANGPAAGATGSTTYYFSGLVPVGKTNANGVNSYDYPSNTILRATNSINGNGDTTTTQYPTAASGPDYSIADPISTTDAMGNKTLYGYTISSDNVPANLRYCTVSPAEVKNGVMCPAYGSVNQPTGASVKTFNSSGQVTTSTDALGGTTKYAYTRGVSGVPNGLLYCTVDPSNYANGVRCPSYGLAATGASTNTYDSQGDLITSTNPTGATTTNCYFYQSCASAAPTGVDGGNATLLYTKTGPNGDVTTYTYNAAGQVTESVVSFGSYSATSITAYDSSGRPYCTESPYDVSLDIYFSSGDASYPYNCPSTPPSSPPSPGTAPWLSAQVTIYNAAGQVADTVSPIGGVTQYAYDGAGNKYCTVGPLAYAKGTTCPTAPPTTPPTQGSDPYLGATITAFNSLDQPIQVTDPIGGITLTSYDQAGNVIQTQVESTDATKAPTVTTTYTYNADNQQISSTVDPGGSHAATTLKSYDPNGSVYCSVSPNAYHAHPYSSTNTGGYQCPTWQPSWISSPPFPSSLYSTSFPTTPAINVTTNFYNANGNLVQTTNPNVDTTATAYDANGRPYCQIDPVNFPSGAAKYPYICPTSPPTSAPTSVTGYTTTIYDAAGNTLSTTDPVGNTTRYTYSPSGLKLTATTGAGSSAAQTTTYCYYYETTSCPNGGAPSGSGAASMLYSIQLPSTEVTTNTYYAGGSLLTKTNPAGTANYVYWENGQLLRFTDSNPSGYAPTLPITKTYYQDGQLCWSARIAVTTVPSCANPPSTGVTTYTYDLAGDMLSQSLAASSPTGFTLSNQVISYTYYRPGNIAQVVYPTYTYTPAGAAPVTVTNPTAAYAYDATGQMTSVADWAQAAAMAANPNLTTTTAPPNNVVTFSHDPNGNLATQDNPGGVNSTFSYDNANQMTKATTQLGLFTPSGISPQVASPGGSIKSGPSTRTTPLTTKTMQGYFGTAKKPASMSTNTTTSTCTNSSATLTQNFGPNQTPGTGSYNQNGQVTQYYQEYLTNCGNSAALQRNYSYDQAGHLTYQGSAPQGSAANNFSYDPSNNPTLVSSHDAAGNFDTYNQSFNSSGQVTSETPITGSKGGSYAYSYNSIGALSNSVSGGYNLSYGYNTIGQMTSYSFISATNYLYNAAGLESALSTGGATTQFTWGNLGGMPQLLSDSKDYFIYGPGTTPVEQYNITSSPPAYNPTFLTYFKPSDTWLVTNLTGQVTNATGYDAGGNVSNGSPGTIFGYQGQYQDTSTNTSGFTNMRARWYDSQSGVFTSVDPALSSTNQPYQYANGDPVNNSDPSGMMSCNPQGAVAPWTPSLVALGGTSTNPQFCASIMGVNWIWNNTLAPLINPYNVGVQSQANMLAQHILTSTMAAVTAMWMDYKPYGGCVPTDAGTNFSCTTSFTSWMSTSPFTSTVLLGETRPWKTWVLDITGAQLVAVVIDALAQAVVNYPAGTVGGMVASQLETVLGFNPTVTLPTAPCPG